jgi:hypothetical protein
MNHIETQAKPSVWNVFGESLFAKRLVYASATFLFLLGTYFVSSSPDEEFAPGTPQVILAGQHLPEPVTMDPQKDRETVLVTLATWGGGEDSQDYQ